LNESKKKKKNLQMHMETDKKKKEEAINTHQRCQVSQACNVLVEHTAVIKHNAWNIALGVDGVEVHVANSGGVGSQVHLLSLEVQTASSSSDEAASTA
jgi:hypothetical protein